MPKHTTCADCGGFFKPRKSDQRFCSEDCRIAQYRKIYPNYMQINITKVCPRCGQGFETTKPLVQTYCSVECRDSKGPLEFLEQSNESMNKFFATHPERQRGYTKQL